MLFRQSIVMFAFLGLLNCGTIPELGSTQAAAARAAPYPDLVPLDTLINAAETIQPQITPASIITTNSRISQLRARAAGLRGPVVDRATRMQMRAAIARAALR
jgi:hypothetical protein